jgi:hypothetical protein
MSLLEQVVSCKGLDAPGIAGVFVAVEQDDVTRELLSIVAERTNLAKLPRLPFVVRHKLYGDLDVSDWSIRHEDGGASVVAAAEDDVADVTLRWEHWEDVVRLINGDTSETALFFTRRVASEDAETDVVAWSSAVDFVGSGEADERPGVLMNALRAASAAGDSALDSFIRDKGLPRLLRARAANMASSVQDIGGADGLRGSYMRLEISVHPVVGVEATFPPDGSPASTRILDTDEIGKEDPEDGVTLRFESAAAFVDAVTFREDMPQQVTSGALRVLGSQQRMLAFSEAMMTLINALRPRVR